MTFINLLLLFTGKYSILNKQNVFILRVESGTKSGRRHTQNKGEGHSYGIHTDYSG
jgi:hypothetical protein